MCVSTDAKLLVTLLVPLVLLVGAPDAAEAESPTLVVCAPGYPGSTAEAQPAMDALAAAVAGAAGPGPDGLEAAYFETEAGGLAALAEPDAGLALLTLPFFLEHRQDLALEPVLLAVPAGRQAAEPWTLVAGAGLVAAPSDLAGWTLVSLAGHSERFVRGPALGGWGELPGDLTVEFSGRVLSALRKAARGEKVAVLLDAEQAAALDDLPFAGDLEVVHRSPPLPVSVLAAVAGRVPAERLAKLTGALQSLDGRPEAAEALAGVRIERFEPVDREALARAEAAFAGVGE
ncbi:MAG TPA: PhnD/SsuA/transferrin family substrate-binding protein [Methylomirabilota bacterium]|nr:PhnD/SsuA/transferrin family substrate-binding protein [Methylomirabilota bacterium]